MAIYHFSVKVVKRSEGKSAVATAAWKADQVLYDERYGLTVHPRQTKTIVLNQILLPASVSARFLDRATLWNAVEVGEARRDSQLARVINVALPIEIAVEEAAELPRAFAAQHLLSQSLPVDLTITTRKAEKGASSFLHAYLMFPTRQFDIAGPTKKHRPTSIQAELAEWRRGWAELVNGALGKAGAAGRVDHRSNACRGLGTPAGEHVGLAATNMARRGEHPDRGPQVSDKARADAATTQPGPPAGPEI